jgi:hypothetical protein
VSAEPARHLRVVEVTDTGEVLTGTGLAELQAEVEKLRVDLKMAQRDVKAKNRRISELERNKAQERLDYERRADVERIATYWHRKCRPDDFARETPRVNPMSPERFDAVRGILDQERLVPVEGQKRARRVPRTRWRSARRRSTARRSITSRSSGGTGRGSTSMTWS